MTDVKHSCNQGILFTNPRDAGHIFMSLPQNGKCLSDGDVINNIADATPKSQKNFGDMDRENCHRIVVCVSMAQCI